MALRSQTQRTLLGGFIVSICCCGLVGIYCLLAGTFDEVAARVLLTTTSVGCASVLALANVMPWEKRRWHPVGPCGLVIVCLAFLLALIGIWVPNPSEGFMKTLFISCVFAVAISHIGLMSLARLDRRFEKLRLATVLSVIILTTQISWSIIAEMDNELWYRLMGVVAILDVCGTIAVPVLHRISAIPADEDGRSGDIASMVSLTCPKCGTTQEVPLGRSQCKECGLKFRFEVEEAS